ncbi:MAG: hypothetical protein Q7R41_08045, partial [Phycisphaerales bacterium]|nr:hypothetical protein [Phycisphaerales bacterium]
ATGHVHPWFLPDGGHFLFYAAPLTQSGESGAIYAGSLDDAEMTLVGDADSRALYADGHIFFVRQGTLLAQPFDPGRRATTGDAVVVATDISPTGNGAAMFSVSLTGVLALRHDGAATTQLTIVDRGGRLLQTVGDRSIQSAVELSPDGGRVVTSVFDTSKRNHDLWIHDLARSVHTRLTFDPGDDWAATWSPDGTRLLFSAARPTRFDLYEKPASGSGGEQRIVGGSTNSYAGDWSPDGRYLLYHNGSAGSRSGNDIWILPTSTDMSRPFVQTPFNETKGNFSADGRWVAYQSSESGREEVYVVPFPGPGGKWQVSTTGGASPRWSHDDKELFFLAGGGTTLMSAAVNGSGNTFEVGMVQRLFDARLRVDRVAQSSTGYTYDVFPDGQRFLIDAIADAQPTEAPIRVITNWTSLLQGTK